MSLFHLEKFFLWLCVIRFDEQGKCPVDNWPQEELNQFILWVSRYQYVLGERTWIEYWPTSEECQTQKHRSTCLGMEEMVESYKIFGCLNKWIHLVSASLISVKYNFYHYARVTVSHYFDHGIFDNSTSQCLKSLCHKCKTVCIAEKETMSLSDEVGLLQKVVMSQFALSSPFAFWQISPILGQSQVSTGICQK